MVKQWVQLPIKKNRDCHLEVFYVFFIRVPSNNFYLFLFKFRFSLEY